MAITDLIARIDSDAAAEAEAITAAARAQADELLAQADASAKVEHDAAIEEAERLAAEEAATLLANTRLAARDGLLVRKRAKAEEVLERARHALETLPDAAYLELIGRKVAAVAAMGDSLAIAPADAKRLAGLAQRLRARGVSVQLSAEAAPLESGVLLSSDRVRLEISPTSLVDDERDELLLIASQALFGGKD